MTREQKLALILGFALVLFVAVILSDHVSSTRQAEVARIDPPRDAGTGTIEEPGLGRNLAFLEETKRPAPATMFIQAGSKTPVESREPQAPPQRGPAVVLPAPADPFQPFEPVASAGRDLMNGQTPPPAVQVDSRPAETARTHTIADGDTLWSIAARYYGSGAAHKKLADYNAGRFGSIGDLRVGASLLIPPPEALGLPAQDAAAAASSEPKAASAAAPAKKADEPKDAPKKKDAPGTYTVRAGDTLASIARKTLGSAGRWEDILDLNRGTIEDETLIPPGTVLRLPKS